MISEGRVEMCNNNTWFAVCNSLFNFDWEIEEATVVCRQLGYTGATLARLLPRFDSRILRLAWNCNGSEMYLQQCTNSSDVYNCAVAGVACHNITGTLSMCLLKCFTPCICRWMYQLPNLP